MTTGPATQRGGGSGGGWPNRGMDTMHTVRGPEEYRARAAALAAAAGVKRADVMRTALAIGLAWLEQTDGAALHAETNPAG